MWLLLLLAVTSATAIINPYPKYTSRASQTQDSPLFLTPYIESGNIEEARKLSLVADLSPNVPLYTGYITTDKKCGDNLFFWFFPSQNDWLNDPVSVWLNGGPGATSMFGLFDENISPYVLTMDGKLELNPYSWNQNSSLIFIDNPVGTGYSFTQKGCYVTNEDEVGQAMLKMLTQFFQLFPELKENPFFLTGESYAGHYIPAIAHAIHNSNPKQINLKGVAINNGLIDPVNQMAYPAYLYQLGLIDDNTRDEMHALEVQIPGLVEAGNFSLANDLWVEMTTMFADIANFTKFFNYLMPQGDPEPDIFGFADRVDVRQAIHVGNATLSNGDEVFEYISGEIFMSVRPWVEELLENNYKVFLYYGQLDIICAYPMSLDFIKKLNWRGAEAYKTAKRNVWYVGEELAGYAKTVENFSEILVRNAGHVVAMYQPKWALDLYNRFIFNQSFIS